MNQIDIQGDGEDIVFVEENTTDIFAEQFAEITADINQDGQIEITLEEKPNIEIEVESLLDSIEVFEEKTTIIEVETVSIPPLLQVSAESLAANFTALEAIPALRIVRLMENNQVALARNNGTEEEAAAIGIAMNGANPGDQVRVMFFGKVEDPFFNYPVNQKLFLGQNGELQIMAGVDGEYRVLVAQSLGTGVIFINIEESILI